MSKLGAIAVMLIVAFVVFWLTGCASKPPKRRLPPAPTVTTEPLRQSIAATKKSTTSAKTRVETVIREVEKIVTVTDAKTADSLRQVNSELATVQNDLNEALAAAETSEVQRIRADADVAKLRDWGISEQATAEANADGWRASEVKGKKAIGKANRLQFWMAGLGAVAGFFVLSRFAMLAAWLPWAGAGAGGILSYLLAWLVL